MTISLSKTDSIVMGFNFFRENKYIFRTFQVDAMGLL